MVNSFNWKLLDSHKTAGGEGSRKKKCEDEVLTLTRLLPFRLIIQFRSQISHSSKAQGNEEEEIANI